MVDIPSYQRKVRDMKDIFNPFRTFQEACEFSGFRLQSCYYTMGGNVLRWHKEEIMQQLYAQFRGWAD